MFSLSLMDFDGLWWTLMGLGTNRKLWVSACFHLERLLGFQSTKQQYKMIIVMRVKPKIVWFFHVVMDVVYQTNMSEIVRGNERAEPGRRCVDFAKHGTILELNKNMMSNNPMMKTAGTSKSGFSGCHPMVCHRSCSINMLGLAAVFSVEIKRNKS